MSEVQPLIDTETRLRAELVDLQVELYVAQQDVAPAGMAYDYFAKTFDSLMWRHGQVQRELEHITHLYEKIARDIRRRQGFSVSDSDWKLLQSKTDVCWYLIDRFGFELYDQFAPLNPGVGRDTKIIKLDELPPNHEIALKYVTETGTGVGKRINVANRSVAKFRQYAEIEFGFLREWPRYRVYLAYAPEIDTLWVHERR